MKVCAGVLVEELYTEGEFSLYRKQIEGQISILSLNKIKEAKKFNSQQGKPYLMLTHSQSFILVSKHLSIDFHVFQSMPGPKEWGYGREKKRLILSF